MLFRDVIGLVSMSYAVNDIGDSIGRPTERQVFANKKSVRQSEFYQAQATGLKPEIMFEIRTADYQEEEQLTHSGKIYSIIRVYDKNGEITELVCSGMVI